MNSFSYLILLCYISHTLLNSHYNLTLHSLKFTIIISVHYHFDWFSLIESFHSPPVYRNLSFTPLQETAPINCPGDVLQYNCSIKSNSDNFVLEIAVTLLDGIRNGQYYFQNTSLLNMPINLVSNPRVTVTLRAINDSARYAEAIIEIAVEVDALLNGSLLECIFDNRNIFLTVDANDPLGNSFFGNVVSSIQCL